MGQPPFTTDIEHLEIAPAFDLKIFTHRQLSAPGEVYQKRGMSKLIICEYFELRELLPAPVTEVPNVTSCILPCAYCLPPNYASLEGKKKQARGIGKRMMSESDSSSDRHEQNPGQHSKLAESRVQQGHHGEKGAKQGSMGSAHCVKGKEHGEKGGATGGTIGKRTATSKITTVESLGKRLEVVAKMEQQEVEIGLGTRKYRECYS